MAKKDIINTVPVEVPDTNHSNNHDDPGELTSNDKAIVKLVNHIVNTPEDRMHETSVLPRRMIAAMAISKTFAEIKDYENENFVLRWMLNYERFSRSIGGFNIKNIVMLAENQLAEEEDNAFEDDTP